jgi:hypothetical protein
MFVRRMPILAECLLNLLLPSVCLSLSLRTNEPTRERLNEFSLNLKTLCCFIKIYQHIAIVVKIAQQ